ncbi:nuclear transport factor 2 family protein [Marimonas arenosa]|uniref:Nuclear transport factor 2 family protein n=1 Tax=Marimonas arenosa TaxID=1795305 RepID=A0AAE3WDU8_9RHOB|nr:nuclear transport factor 2 family protein [Marimonas arenosa]MDQ2089935.1 nuclear transport factor 2 family protein [Marimonas arenosa]
MTATDTIRACFDAIDVGDAGAMLTCLAGDAALHVNQGSVRLGRDGFAELCARTNRCSGVARTDWVIFEAATGTRAAEDIVNGTYLETDAGLPEARGQTYRLPAAALFALEDGVAAYSSLADRMAPVSA